MKLRYILEELEDKPSRMVYHFTDIVGLERILDTGFLRGSERSTSTREGTKELAVVRPSSNLAKGSGVHMLSGQASPSIRFLLYPERIQDAVKGVKLRTVADYPSQTIDNIGRTLKSRIHDSDLTKNQLKKLTNLMMKIVQQERAKIKDAPDYPNMRAKKAMQKAILSSDIPRNIKSYFENLKDIEGVLSRIWFHYNALTSEQKNREGEERITMPKNTNIPLDPRYMRLEVRLSDDIKDELEGIVAYKPQEIKNFLANIKKHKEVFTSKSYKELVNFIVEILKIK